MDLKCWGSNDYGELGLGDDINRGDDPGEMGNNLSIIDLGGRIANSVAVGLHSTCVILDDDSAMCWGDNWYGQLGQGDLFDRGNDEMIDSLPAIDLGTDVSGDSHTHTAKVIRTGGSTVCTILDNDRVKCWGDNNYGKLGKGNETNLGDDPNEMGDNLGYVDLGTGRTAKDIAVGDTHVCTILDNDRLKCWGKNNGQLGLEDIEDRGDQPNEMGDNLPFVDL